MTAFKPIAFTLLLVSLVTFLVVKGTVLAGSNNRNDNNFLLKIYQQQRASGKLHPFGEVVLQSLLGSSKATATPSKYGSYKVYSPLSTASNPCAAPVVFGASFGLGICYAIVDPITNTTGSNIIHYNSTTGSYKQYNTNNCTGPVANSGSVSINACASDNIVKFLPSSSSPAVSTKPGALFTLV